MNNRLKRVIRLGSRGNDVAEIQASLNKLPSTQPRLVADGIYGTKTAGRVKEFQRKSR